MFVRLLEARRAFADLPVVQVATTRPDGSPHSVPLWFVWRNEAIYVSCRRGSTTWKAIERDPRIALSLSVGSRWEELSGAVIYGRADPIPGDHPAVRGVMSQWYEKYGELLSGEGFRRYAEDVDEPGMLRVRPLRVAAWDHAHDREADRAAEQA